MVWRKTSAIENTVNRLKRGVLAGTLISWLLVGATTAEAASALQDDPARQCAAGVQLFQADHYAEALPLLEAGFAARDRATFAHSDDLGLCALALGMLRTGQSDHSGALTAFGVALETFRSSQNRTGEGATLNKIGEVYQDQGHYSEAVEHFKGALTIYRALDNHANEANTLNNLGLAYQAQGRSDPALEHFQEALSIYQALGDHATTGTLLANLGLAYYTQGRYDAALDHYRQALTIHQEVHDRTGEASTLQNMGAVYRGQGQYGQALAHYQRALAIYQALDDRPGQATSLNSIGLVYRVQGQFDAALKHYHQALAIVRDLHRQANEGTTLSSIGAVYYARKQYDEAVKHLQQALSIHRALKDRTNESTTLNNLGLVAYDQGQYTSALEYFQQALNIRREMGNRAEQGTALNNLGLVYYVQGRYDQALEHFQQALSIHQELRNRADEGSDLNNLGHVYDALGKTKEALDAYSQAMDILEEVRAVVDSEQGRAGFINIYASLYGRAAALYHQQGRDDLAFLTAERGRARAFLDSLVTGSVQLSDQEVGKLLERERETYAAQQSVQDALVLAHAASPPDPGLVAELEMKLKAAEQTHTAALDAIEHRGDQLTALVPSRTQGVLDLPRVQARLERQTTLLSYFVTDDQTLAFLITHDHFQTFILPIGRAELRDQVRALLDSPAFQQTAHPPEAVALYNALIAPLKPYLTTRHLTVIPHGPLHYLPFSSLSDAHRYLVDDYVLSTLPSASVLPFIQANTGHPLTAPLVLGNPDGTLRFAEQEARVVASLYGVQPLIGPQATKDALQKQVPEAGIVHLATHAAFDPNVPLASSITLAPTVTSTVRLEASEVYALDLHKADLVVLSACQTNLGDVSAGDEVVGLTRAFFFAGTPTVISSLWSVDDAATGLLMERFYTHLRAGMGKAEALRQAQMDVRAQYPAPYYWAGFVLAGDAGRVTEPGVTVWWWLGGALALLMIGLACALNLLYQRVIPRAPGIWL